MKYTNTYCRSRLKHRHLKCYEAYVLLSHANQTMSVILMTGGSHLQHSHTCLLNGFIWLFIEHEIVSNS